VKFRLLTSDNVRSFVLGIEDSLVSTIGLISGIAAAGSSSATIVLTGVILIFVEAFSMAVGELLANTTVKEFEEHQNIPLSQAKLSGLIMLVSYITAGFLVLSPYIFFPVNNALPVSIGIALCLLFVLGVTTAEISRIHPVKKGLTMAVVGGIAILIGVLAGYVIEYLQTAL
jgi:VIT1/CCC1 family predicted Fe2+/Mn2+ transporter